MDTSGLPEPPTLEQYYANAARLARIAESYDDKTLSRQETEDIDEDKWMLAFEQSKVITHLFMGRFVTDGIASFDESDGSLSWNVHGAVGEASQNRRKSHMSFDFSPQKPDEVSIVWLYSPLPEWQAEPVLHIRLDKLLDELADDKYRCILSYR